MRNTWFISDTHFGHANILEFEKEARPFESLEEMHEVMIERWNNTVNPGDSVYHLGDFCFGRKNIEIGSRLNGKKFLVLGNHDTYPSADYLCWFDRLFGATFWKNCILSHVPVHPDQLGKRSAINVHGHLHSRRVKETIMEFTSCETIVDDRRYFNVSCEQNNLTPIHADCILLRVKEICDDIGEM